MVYGSTPRNWGRFARLAKATGTHFVPSVGPGYVDTSVRLERPATRSRQRGRYYDDMWAAALALVQGGARHLIVVVVVVAEGRVGDELNEWHEGTQIEPAVPASRRGANGNGKYEDYGALGRVGTSNSPPSGAAASPRKEPVR